MAHPEVMKALYELQSSMEEEGVNVAQGSIPVEDTLKSSMQSLKVQEKLVRCRQVLQEHKLDLDVIRKTLSALSGGQ